VSKKAADRSRSERAAAAIAAQERRERGRNLAIVGAVVGVLLVIVVVLFLTLSSQDTTGHTASEVPPHLTGGYGVMVGDPSAPTTITLYEDPQCPICREFESVTGAKVSQAVADGKVKVDYRMVSFLDRSSQNQYSSRALNALMVVYAQGGADAFAKFHSYLYAHQPAEGTAGPSDQELIDAAVKLGSDRTAITPGIEKDIYSQWVVNATDQMSKHGVNGTPTAFINGKPAGSSVGQTVQAVLDAVG
jgi:protein-disulfide isomerase